MPADQLKRPQRVAL